MKTAAVKSSLLLFLGVGIGVAVHALLPIKSPSASADASASALASALPKTSGTSSPPADLRPASLNVQRIIEDFLGVEWSDSVALIRASGELHALDPSGIHQAWQILESRAQTGTHQEKALALYLWSRLARLDPSLRLPEAWSRDMNPEALVAERVRLSMSDIRARLLSGDSVDEAERKAFFRELAARDPAAGLEFWLQVSNHLEHLGELSPFGPLLRDPATREPTLARVRAAARSGSDAEELILALASPWIVADLTASAAWIQSLSDPGLRRRLESQLLVAQSSARPRIAFNLSENLPREQRIIARATSINQLAYDNPADGMLLIDSVRDAEERAELIRAFGNTLAMHDATSWLAWRDALPAADRDAANTSGFATWMLHRPAEAAAWLQAQPVGQSRDQLATELVRITAASQTETAITWINQIQNPRDRMMAISTALGNLAHGDTDRMEAILRATMAGAPPPGS